MNHRRPHSRLLALLAALALGFGGVAAWPISASAATDPWPGFDVQIAGPGQPSILTGSDVYVHVDTPTDTFATITSALAVDLEVELRDSSAQTLAGCTITAGSTACGLSSVQLVVGSQAIHLWASDGTTTFDQLITFFGVDPVGGAQTTSGLEWRDAAGTWRDGTIVSTRMLADQPTAYRLWLRNDTNAPIRVQDFVHDGADSVVDGEIGAGATAYGPGGGPARADARPSSVGSGWSFTDSAGYPNGNGTGGGLAVVPGSASLSTSTASPGDTVTLTGTDFFADGFDEFDVFFNSTPVALGSVVADQGGAFALTFTVPASAAPGPHTVTLLNGDYAVAALPLAIPGLAATGVDAMPYVVIAILLLAAGIAALVVRGVINARRKD
jgi:hypothetical protein